MRESLTAGIPLLLLGVWYLAGLRTLRRRRHRPLNGRMWAMLGGWLTVAIAILPPFDELADHSFTAHMIQHELLIAFAAPLFVFAQPGPVLLWAFPNGVRRAIGGTLTTNAFRNVWRVATRPFDAWLLHAIALWIWHIPTFFDAALENNALHALQHVCFLGSGVLFWWTIIHPRRRAALGLSVIYLFTTALHTAALGALLATSRTPWYSVYAGERIAGGLTPLEDQQLAGLIMWIPAGLVYLGAALLTVRRWLAASERSVALDSPARLAGPA